MNVMQKDMRYDMNTIAGFVMRLARRVRSKPGVPAWLRAPERLRPSARLPVPARRGVLARFRAPVRRRAWLWSGALLVALSLGACTQEETTNVAMPALLETGADGVIIGLQTNVTLDGVRQGEIIADTAFTWEDSDSTAYHLRNPVMTFYDQASGMEKARLVAERARLDTRTQALNAYGNVVLTIAEGNRKVESSELNYDPDRNQIWSDSFTVMHDQGTVVEGMGFTSDLEFRQYRVGPGSIRNRSSGGGGPA